MFTFQDYCKIQVSNSSLKYFWMEIQLYDLLTPLEQSLVHAEEPRLTYRRCWYPASNYVMSDIERKHLLLKAFEMNDMEAITRLTQTKKVI